jgi:hypothetical protein
MRDLIGFGMIGKVYHQNLKLNRRQSAGISASGFCTLIDFPACETA